MGCWRDTVSTEWEERCVVHWRCYLTKPCRDGTCQCRPHHKEARLDPCHSWRVPRGSTFAAIHTDVQQTVYASPSSWRRIGSDPFAFRLLDNKPPARKLPQVHIAAEHRKQTRCRGACVCLPKR